MDLVLVTLIDLLVVLSIRNLCEFVYKKIH